MYLLLPRSAAFVGVTLLSMACTGAEAPPEVAPVTDAEAGTAAAATLCKLAERAQLACVAEGAEARLGERTLRADATVTGFLALPSPTVGSGAQARQLPGEVQLTVSIALSVDGAPLATGSVHEVESDVDVAGARGRVLDTAAQRWAMGVGIAALDAVAGGAAAPALGAAGLQVPATDVGGVRAWAGFPALRGKGFDPNLALQLQANVASMGAALGPYVEGLEAGPLHTVRVKARLGGDGAPGPCGILPQVTLTEGATASIVPLAGEVLVDGAATGTICGLSEPVAWPVPQGGAVLEWDQVFVVQVGPPDEAQGDPTE